MRDRILALVMGWLLACLALAVNAQEPRPVADPAAPPRSPRAVAVQPVLEPSVAGRLKSLRDGRLLLEHEDGPRELATADLLRLDFAPVRTRTASGDALVLLANGDRLRARPIRMDDEKIIAEWETFETLPEVSVPLETIRALVLNMPSIPAVRDELLAALRDRDEESDLLLLTKGDRLTGELLEIGEETVRLKGVVGETDVAREGIRAIGFNPALTSFPQAKGPRTVVYLRDGSRITADTVEIGEGDAFQFSAVFGAKMTVPLTAVSAVHFLGGRAESLAEREPVAYRHTPYLSRDWKLARDRNVTGGPLRLRGVEYPRGLGMHSRSEVTYELSPQDRWFRATAGIDDAAGPRGSAVFAVEADGRRVFTSEPQTTADTPLEIGPLDLMGVKRLTLIVDYGPFGDVQDYADWVDAVLIK